MLSAVAARKAAQAQNLTNGKSSSETSTVSVKANLVNAGAGNVAATTRKRQNEASSRGTASANEDETPEKPGPSKRNTTPRRKRPRKKETRRYFDQMDVDATAMDVTDEDELFGLHLTSQPVTPPLQESYVDPIKQGNKRRAWSPSQPVGVEDSSDSFSSDDDKAIPPASAPQAVTSQVPTAKDPYALLSTYSPSSKSMFEVPTTSSRSSKLLLLDLEERVTLLGVYSLVVLKGDVQLQGTRLTPSPFPHEMFAPRCSPLGAITALVVSEPTDATLDMLPADLRQVVSSHAGCAVLVSDLNTGIEGLGRVVRTFEDMFRPPSGGGYMGIDIGLKTAVMVRDPHLQLQPFSIPETWTHAIESSVVNLAGEANQSVPRPPVFLVRGPKGSGKSSFCQMLIGGLLQRYKRVALLDTDPGQPIFAPPSLLSLHVLTSPIFGSSFANPRVPHRAHFFGSITPRSNPIRWLEYVEELVERWKLEVSFPGFDDEMTDTDERITEVVPLVVNTCGWTKGYGAELLAKLEEMCRPDCLCAFPEVGGAGDDPTPSSSAGLTYLLEPIPPSALSSRFTAADMRNLSLMSYFHSRLSTSNPTVTWDTTTSLLGMQPWQVTYSSGPGKDSGSGRAIDRVYLSGPWADDIVHSGIGRVMDCAIVGLIIDETSDTASSPTGIPYTQGSPLPPASESSCPGLGLIRAIDTSRSAFHLLTPLPPHLLPRCRAMVKGEVELPIWGFLEFGEDSSGGAGAPYLDWGKASRRGVVGGERRRVRRNLMRKGQM